MAQQNIIIGAQDAGTGDTYFDAFTKVQANFNELFATNFDTIKIVKSEADFPAVVSVGGIDSHVLEEKHYIIDGDFSISNPIAYPGAGKTATISALNRSVLTYTGNQAMFNDPNAQGNIEISGLTEFRAPGAKFWNLTASTGSFSFQASGGAAKFTQCESLGVVNCNGVSGFNIFFGTLSDFNQGLIVNNPAFFELAYLFAFGNNVTGCKYFTVQGAGTVGSVNFDTLTVGSGSNETLFDINSNIQSSVDAINIRSISQEGGINGTIFAPGSLTGKSEKVLADGNSILGNTRPGGLLSLTGNAVDTVITAINTPVLVAGMWVVQDVSQFSGTTAGRLTHVDERLLSIDIDASISVEPAAGNGIVIRAYLSKNGVVIPASAKSVTADNGKAGNMSIAWRTDSSAGDYYEIYLENKTNDTDLTAIDVTMRIP